MPKARIKREKDFEKGTVDFTVLETGETFHFDINNYSEKIQRCFATMGGNNVFGDTGADSDKDAIAEMKRRDENFRNDVWSTRGDGSGGGGQPTLLFEAAKRLYPDVDEADVKTKIESLSDDEKTDLKKHPKIAAFLDEIKKERQNAKAKKSKAAAADDQTDALTF